MIDNRFFCFKCLIEKDKMKKDKKYKVYKNASAIKSRKRKDTIINVMVLSIITFITVLLISEMT
ncbi:hypothetical protein FF52_05320 [Flavobacterium sp. F52]|nr:hypothetical protein FF52_05320 [Flavobacterium sp. F52]